MECDKMARYRELKAENLPAADSIILKAGDFKEMLTHAGYGKWV
jgi:hypothetical protein